MWRQSEKFSVYEMLHVVAPDVAHVLDAPQPEKFEILVRDFNQRRSGVRKGVSQVHIYPRFFVWVCQKGSLEMAIFRHFGGETRKNRSRELVSPVAWWTPEI